MCYRLNPITRFRIRRYFVRPHFQTLLGDSYQGSSVMFSSNNVISHDFNSTTNEICDSTRYVPSFNPSAHVDVKTMIDALALADVSSHLGIATHDLSLACWTELLPRKRVSAGAQLICEADIAKALYVVRTGSFKSVVLDASGVAQIVGFPMRGEMLGAQAFAEGRYSANVYALEDSDVIVLTLAKLTELSRAYPGFEQIVFRSMAKSLVREQNQLWALGSQCATARLAQFLLQLAAFYAQAGYAANEFTLRMTRTDIASYLSLTIETVSRTFATLQSADIIEVHQRSVKLLDIAGLKQFCRGGARVSAKDLVKANVKRGGEKRLLAA